MTWAPNYIEDDELKAYLVALGGKTDVTDDVHLALAISAASRAIDTHTRRQFGKVDTPEPRTYTTWFNHARGVWIAEVDDLMDLTGFTVLADGTTDVTASVRLEPLNAPQKGRPYTRVVLPTRACEVTPTGFWGWDAYPDPVRQAGLLQSARFFMRRQSVFGVLGSPDSPVGELRLLARVDPDVAVSLAGYVKSGAVG